ncbi:MULTISPECIES: GNAT family N-acetyltransferase [Oleiagrimonas]|jgi:[ribosomal protein S5]-alanine N-acetyltransferase|uniref:GNAT family N-acetyltransferase n=1 Tax=Oleiagrimonas citrea TaxID=1665687 RepID=A0A846ZK73_9GAMM|nr:MULTISPECIES: GNAT family N-acetyltransferase [Oleiagrimonas]NKZ37983.1 GNAT family N-acetyltransferase [Oleiagrimonas citrea]RAP57469.1 GNAT family N-acetyltransferase [Oleiagrimonas sp. MCCC 1A03011]
MTDIPILETPRLRLTALAERHFDDYAEMLADPESTRYVGSGVPLDRVNAWRSMAMLLGHWTLRGFGMWAVERREDDQFVGRVGLMFPEGWPNIELGWMLRPEHRGQGYATEAGRAALDFAWRQLRIPRVISLVRDGNEASDRVAKRLGGEYIEAIDFLGSPTHVFAYYPPQRNEPGTPK